MKIDKKLLKVVKKAGEIALAEQENLITQTKKDGSLVTNGDLTVSAFLEKELKKLYPNYDIFSEENCLEEPKSNNVIVIDPIDGTESYSRKQDTWAILIGFMTDNNITAGVVYQPSKNLLYYGNKGEGAYLVKDNESTKLEALCHSDELTLLLLLKIKEN